MQGATASMFSYKSAATSQASPGWLAYDSITRRCRRIRLRRTCQRSISWGSAHCALEKSHPVVFIVNVYGIGLVGIFWWILPSQRCNFVAIFDVGNDQYLCNRRDLPLKLVALLCQYLRWWSWEGTVFDAEWRIMSRGLSAGALMDRFTVPDIVCRWYFYYYSNREIVVLSEHRQIVIWYFLLCI
jgi:hypothetical protein